MAVEYRSAVGETPLSAIAGFDLLLDRLPLDIRIHPLRAMMHAVRGAAGDVVGFLKPRSSLPPLILGACSAMKARVAR